MEYSVPPMLTRLPPDSAHVHSTPIALADQAGVLGCAYCLTPRASRYDPCPNCGAYEVVPVQRMAQKRTVPPMPKPNVTTEYK